MAVDGDRQCSDPAFGARHGWVITSLVIATMGLIPVDQVVTVRGIAISKAATILVQPLETAIVRSIDVREGQQVKAGEVLAKLDPTFAAARLGALTAQVSSLEAEVARIQAEAENKPFDYSGLDPDLALQGAIYAHRKAEYAAKVEGYARKFDELAAVIARSQSDAAGYRDRLGLAQTVEQMRAQLEARQVGSRLNTLAAMDSRAEMARALANAQQTAEGARRNLAAMTAERDAYIQGWRAEVSQKLSEETRKLSDVREQLNKAKLRRELVELRAEAGATVQSVAKVSVGSVMQSGQHFITLVPADAPLEIEANIFGRDNGLREAQVALAEMMVNGRGGPQDTAAALELFEKAAAEGHSGAMFALRALHAGGHDLPEDRAAAQRWFRAAAELGHGQAQLMLGRYLAEGVAGEPNPADARSWFEQAAAQGIEEAQAELAALPGVTLQ